VVRKQRISGHLFSFTLSLLIFLRTFLAPFLSFLFVFLTALFLAPDRKGEALVEQVASLTQNRQLVKARRTPGVARVGRRFRHWSKVVCIPRVDWHIGNIDPFKDTLFQEIASSVIGAMEGFNRIFTHKQQAKVKRNTIYRSER